MLTEGARCSRVHEKTHAKSFCRKKDLGEEKFHEG